MAKSVREPGHFAMRDLHAEYEWEGDVELRSAHMEAAQYHEAAANAEDAGDEALATQHKEIAWAATERALHLTRSESSRKRLADKLNQRDAARAQQTGKRGGRFYLNASGKKVYLKG